MTFHEYAKLASEMRFAQRVYHRTGSPRASEKAQTLEDRFDAATREILQLVKLFGEETVRRMMTDE